VPARFVTPEKTNERCAGEGAQPILGTIKGPITKRGKVVGVPTWEGTGKDAFLERKRRPSGDDRRKDRSNRSPERGRKEGP